ncbi:TrkA family potassium uptake protein [Varibaculum cambriense]|uniref:potassium channel family protein n=1 Tax=Varibaculum cambriense TaxID=184870 RepID=UPI00290A5263|nr:TrkA family potassium uptake protein [Varibaculum cambriense]MDU3275176.1 TrkA family potassium uptake protein [Varibaculum cambriense]
MQFVVLGSGRVGARVAQTLDEQGHSVAIIDSNPDAFRKLPTDFSGQKVSGIGFDREVLERANIEEAYAFAAISNGDNTNILAARIARETFGIDRVVARIYDIRRAEIYRKLGINTTSPVSWTASEMLRLMLPDDTQLAYSDSVYQVKMLRIFPCEDWVGVSLQQTQKLLDIKVAYIGRDGEPYFNLSTLVIQEGDELICTVPSGRAEQIERAFKRPPAQEE